MPRVNDTTSHYTKQQLEKEVRVLGTKVLYYYIDQIVVRLGPSKGIRYLSLMEF